jgi:O-antigen/teichoic acid export membrane protein
MIIFRGQGNRRVAIASNRALRVVSWTVVDQALSALSNLGLSIAVARTTSASGFGAFAVAFVLFGISLAITKSAVGQPLQMRLSGASGAERRNGFQAALGAATVLGGVFGLLVSVAGLVVGGEVGGALVALALVLPGLMLQDSCRMAAFTLGRPQLAALIDAVWTAVQFGLLAVLISNGQHQVGGLILAWGGAAAASALLGATVLRARPVPSRARGWVREHGDLIRYLLPEYFLGLGAMQFGILLVGAVASATAVGSLRAAQVLLGPLGIVGAAVFQFAVPEVARRGPVSARWLASLAAALSGGLGLLTIGYLAVMLLLPDAVGVVLFGSSWAGAAAVLLAMGLSSVSSSLANGPAGVLYGLGQARATFRINLAKGPVLLLALLAGTFLAGAVGAAWALAAVEAVVVPVWIVTLRRALGRLGSQSQGKDPSVPVELPRSATPATRDGTLR